MISGYAFFREKDDPLFAVDNARINQTCFKPGPVFTCKTSGYFSFHLCIIYALMSLLASCYRPDKTTELMLAITCLMPSWLFVEGNSLYIPSASIHIHNIIWKLSHLLRSCQLNALSLPPDKTLKKPLMICIQRHHFCLFNTLVKKIRPSLRLKNK